MDHYPSKQALDQNYLVHQTLVGHSCMIIPPNCKLQGLYKMDILDFAVLLDVIFIMFNDVIALFKIISNVNTLSKYSKHLNILVFCQTILFLRPLQVQLWWIQCIQQQCMASYPPKQVLNQKICCRMVCLALSLHIDKVSTTCQFSRARLVDIYEIVRPKYVHKTKPVAQNHYILYSQDYFCIH